MKLLPARDTLCLQCCSWLLLPRCYYCTTVQNTYFIPHCHQQRETGDDVISRGHSGRVSFLFCLVYHVLGEQNVVVDLFFKLPTPQPCHVPTNPLVRERAKIQPKIGL